MKIGYFTAGFDGCFYVRCQIPASVKGHFCDVPNLYSKRLEPEITARMASQLDFLVFHRPQWDHSVELIRRYKAMGKKIVVDNDDTYRNAKEDVKTVKYIDEITKDKAVDATQKFEDNLAESARLADVVTLSTPLLAEEYRQWNKNVFVTPNCIKLDDWEKPKKNTGDKIRVGFIGSVSTEFDYFHLKDYLRELAKKVTIVVFGVPSIHSSHNVGRELIYKDDLDFWREIGAEMHPRVEIVDYIHQLNSLRLDFAIVPRKDSYFNRCKSNIKFLELSMLEVPIIAQGFSTGDSPYQGKDEAYMDIAIEDKDWSVLVDNMIASKEKRETMGKKAREYVIANYDIEKNYHLYQQAYESII
jgi:glycosyltransferase involved in cell wall biosynthesis